MVSREIGKLVLDRRDCVVRDIRIGPFVDGRQTHIEIVGHRPDARDAFPVRSSALCVPNASGDKFASQTLSCHPIKC